MGHCEVGKLPGNYVRLDLEGVSRHHASLTRTDSHITVADLNSTNGTYVNGRRLDGVSALHDGDRLRIGAVELRLSWPQGPRRIGNFDFRDVHGSVNAGSGQQYVAGRDQFVSGRDMYGDDNRVIVTSGYDNTDEAFQGQGIGRFLTIIGYLIALAGAGLFVFTLLSLMASAGPPVDDSNPFAERKLFGVPTFALGFAGAGIGSVVAAIGSGMSKVARKRQEEIEYRNRVRRPRRP